MPELQIFIRKISSFFSSNIYVIYLVLWLVKILVEIVRKPTVFSLLIILLLKF